MVATFSYTVIQCIGCSTRDRGEIICLSSVIVAAADRLQEMPSATLTAIQDVVGLLMSRVCALMWAVGRLASFIFARSASVPVKYREPFNKRLLFFILISILCTFQQFLCFFFSDKYFSGFRTIRRTNYADLFHHVYQP